MREFRDEQYESKDEKRRLGYELLQLAREKHHFQIIDILEPYCNIDLKPDIPSDAAIGDAVTLNKPNKKLLLGFVTGLGSVIADSSVTLDPTDPDTHKRLFSSLTAKLEKRLKQIKQTMIKQDAERMHQEDSADMTQQLSQMENKLTELDETKKGTIISIQERERKISEVGLSALQRKALLEEKEEYTKHLIAYDCSIELCQRQQEMISNRQKKLQSMQDDTNSYLFYRTIENRLQSLFHKVMAAQSGASQTVTESATTVSTSKLLGFSEVLMGALKETVGDILPRLNQEDQKQEWYTISTMGNVEAINRLATDTAGLMTLYYKDQIQSIDGSCKIAGVNPYNDQLQWIKHIFINIPDESVEEIPVIIVADYVTAWIIDALKTDRQEIKPYRPLPQQLWYLVARKDLIDQKGTSKTSNTVKISAGQHRIPLINKKKDIGDTENSLYVQLRFLIGCVSVVGFGGAVYQCSLSPEQSTSEKLDDLELYGYVFISLFSPDENVLQSIVSGRKLKLAVRNNQNDIVTKLTEMQRFAAIFMPQGTDQPSQLYETREMAKQVTHLLRKQNMFVNVSDVQIEMKKTKQVISFTVDAFKEEINERVEFCRTSIQAAHEQIQEESAKNRAFIKRENEERYHQAISKLSQELKEMVNERMNTIEAAVNTKMAEVVELSKATKDQSEQMLIQVTQSSRASEESAEASKNSWKSHQQSLEVAEQRSQQLQKAAHQCVVRVEDHSKELKESFEKFVSELSIESQKKLAEAEQRVKQSAAEAKESAKFTQDTSSSMRALREMTDEQLTTQKTESKRMLSEVHEIRRYADRSADSSKEAQREARRAADASVAALKKLQETLEKKN